MGIEYFGILYEDSKVVVAVSLGKYVDKEYFEKCSKYLTTLFFEAPKYLRELEEEDVVTNYRSINALTRIAELVEKATVCENTTAIAYIWLCRLVGVEPKIVSEYELFPETGKYSKKVCILGDKCY
ncbi:MAG: hypothetical protein GXO26_09400 [Crenarchaeota archaeon]|nr:hypothetical protein [Thermoproteota archaeon]